MTAKKRQFKFPRNAHPLIRQLADIISVSPYSVSALGRTAGITSQTIHGWFRRHNPSIDNLEAVLNALGYRLTIIADVRSSTASNRSRIEAGDG